MLAFELYWKNKNLPIINSDPERLFKKIFYADGKARLDGRTCDEYGSRIDETTRTIQERLKMPFSAIEADRLNLPNRATSNSEPPPYIRFSGEFKAGQVVLTIGKKRDKDGSEGRRSYVLNLESGQTEADGSGTVVLRLDRGKYAIDGKPLFGEYEKSGLVDGNGVLNDAACDTVANTFLDAAKVLRQNAQRIRFNLFVLPTDGKIKYLEPEMATSEDAFVDGFGSKDTHYPTDATKDTKFLTFDDRIYTPNCVKSADFYRSLGIGAASLERVYVDPRYSTNIAGMTWTFVSLGERTLEPVGDKAERTGLLTWLRANYRQMERKADGVTRAGAMMKVLCIKHSNSQQELLVDENLTMERLSDMFDGLPELPAMCLEILIDKTGKNPIWDTYMNAARSFLTGRRVQKEYLLSFFNRFMIRKGTRWRVDERNRHELERFFQRSDFCIKILYRHVYQEYMSAAERYAESVGKVARCYVDFKKKTGGADNSLSDMLSYSKYDRERLRFVVARVGRGINLSHASDDAKSRLEAEIAGIDMGGEIPETDSQRDYSYFFFKGYYWKVDSN